MKYTRILFAFLFFFSFTVCSYGQGAERITGSYEPNETCKINYSISPLPLADNMVFELSVTQPCALDAHIINSEGKELLSINSGTVARRLGKNVDISALAPGSYYVEITCGEGNEPHRIPFTKSK